MFDFVREKQSILSKLLRPIVVLALVVPLTFAATLFAVAQIPSLFSLVTKTESVDTRIASAISLQKKVVLLRLGVQGISEEKAASEFWGYEIPGSSHVLYLQYSYSAMLGVDASDVEIKKVNDKEIVVKVPEFEFIGHDDADFKTAIEQDGVVSFITPEIDVPKAITRILSQEVKDKSLLENDEILRLQTESYFNSIIKSVAPDVKVTYEFAGK